MVTRKLPDAINLDAYDSIDPREQAEWDTAQNFAQEVDPPEYPRQDWRRRASLEPEVLADPPLPARRSSLTASLIRMAAVAALVTGAGFAAYTFVGFEAHQQEASLGTLGARSPSVVQERGFDQRASLPMPRLNVETTRARAGQAAPLGISLQGAVPADASVVVAGLPENATISAGERFGTTAWIVPAGRLTGATVKPRPDFTGTADLMVEVVMPDGTTADRGVVRLEWVSPPPPPATTPVATVQPPATPPVMAAAPPPASPAVAPPVPKQAAPAARPQQAAPAARPQPATPAVRQQETAPPATASPAPQRTMGQEEIAVLLKQAETFLNARDVAAARVMLRRAAEARSPEAAYALAATYDPSVLRALGVVGIQGEQETARVWYERAAQYGSAEARTRLNEIAQASSR